MQRVTGSLVGLIFTLCSLSAFAEGAVIVQAMNYPAWLVRDYQTLPLRPGTRLRHNDLVRTGDGGRLQLQLLDGRVIKLGEASRFVVENGLGEEAALESAFRALRGVIRITSAAPETATPDLRLEINIGAIKVSLRDADVWGRADLAQDAVCLVEGEIVVEAAGVSRVDMNQALSCYVKPRDQVPLPVDLIDLQQHQLWIDETELRDDSGIATAAGQWQLVLISLTDENSAERELNSFQDSGFAVLDKTVVRNGRALHRLLLPGFVSIDAALNARARVEKQLGLSGTWVWRANRD